MTFGEKLRKYRLQKKMTQEELGKAAGLGTNTIRNYEKALELYPDAGDARRRLKKLQKQ